MQDFLDLTKDQGVKKKIITSGSGESTPKLGQQLECFFPFYQNIKIYSDLYTARLNDSVGAEFGTMIEYVVMREDPFTQILGQSKLIKGLEIGLMSMKKGEKAFIYISPPYAYGDKGLEPKVPPNMAVIYEIELISFCDYEKSKWDYTLEEKIQLINQFKDQGNTYFKDNQYKEAKEEYAKAWDLIEMEQRPSVQSLKLSVVLNLSFVLIKLENYEVGKYFAEVAVGIDPQSAKAYYRKGTCEFKLNQVKDACETLKTAYKFNDSNQEIRNFLKVVENVMASNQI